MTNSIRKITVKNSHMTKNDVKYGCLSKTLENFLLMNEEKREQKYGKGKAKYYQRVVLDVQESFRDIVLAYARLPTEHSRKIELRLGLDLIRKEIMKQKSAKDKANFSISQASQALNFVLTELAYPDKITDLFSDDFDKVQKWLVVLDELEPELKKTKN